MPRPVGEEREIDAEVISSAGNGQGSHAQCLRMPERLRGNPGGFFGMPEQSNKLLQPKKYRYES